VADQFDPASPAIRAVRPGDDLEAQLDLGERSFGPMSPARRVQRRQAMAAPIADGRSFGAFEGDRPAAAAMFHDMRQWWCGRVVPMAGVAGVMVAPEDRGRGIGRRLMTAVLDEVAGRGYPLSALYPATMPLYRSLGWELAGLRETAVIPARSLRDLVPPDPVIPDAAAGTTRLRRAGPGDAEAVIAIIGQVHVAARDCGPITRDAASVASWLADPDLYAYLCHDGVLSYRWYGENHDALLVEHAEAVSAPAQRAFWAHVGSHASIADQVYARVGPADALWWLTRERDADVHHRSMWMLRVVDAPGAIAARGFPDVVSLTVPLAITDQARPANSGRWQLTVADGKGALEPLTTGPGTPLTLGARGLAALYAGTPAVVLRQAGLAAGGSPQDDAALDAAFGGTAYMLDAF
jgi:predicted acetyltransferase